MERDGFLVLRGAVDPASIDDLPNALRPGARRRIAAIARQHRSAPRLSIVGLDSLAPGASAGGRPEPPGGGTAAGSTAVLWVAVDDIVGHAGQLRVLPGSHVAPVPSTAYDAATGSDRRSHVAAALVDVPLRRGDAVLLDPRTAACRHPNHTATETSGLVMTVADPGATGGDPVVTETLTSAIDEPTFEHLGFTAARLLDAQLLRSAREIADRLGLPRRHGFFVSPREAHGATARQLDLELQELLADRLRQLVPGHRPLYAAIASKGERCDEPVAFHQDLTVTDERHHRAVLLWCPLVDVDRSRAGLDLVVGSHRWTDAIRPGRAITAPRAPEPFEAEFRKIAMEVPMWAGDTLVFDPALLHGSGPNRSDRSRPAIIVVMIPDDASPLYFHLDEDDRLTGHRVDDAFFTTYDFGVTPEGYPPVEPWTRAVDGDDFARGLTTASLEPATHPVT